jgi:hypothetical protein
MPEGMNKKLVSVSNRQDGVPNQDEVFTEDSTYKWQEFYNSDFPPGGYRFNKDKLPRVKVDLEKADQLYYYLPAKSTEAKCFFTDKVGGTEHVPRSNFLDRVAPPKPTYAYTAPRHSLVAPPPVPRTQPSYSTPSAFQQALDKPYAYKPRVSTQSNILALDTQALANQQNYPTHAGQPDLYGRMQSPALFERSDPQLAGGSRRGSENEAAAPLRPFSQDQYYSTRVLPAAWHGEYSSFQREVRKSQGAQTLPRPSFQHERLPPIYNHTPQPHPTYGYAPAASMSRPAGSPNMRQSTMHIPYGQGAHNAPQTVPYNHSPYAMPPTPATTISASSRQPPRTETNQDHLNHSRTSLPSSDISTIGRHGP